MKRVLIVKLGSMGDLIHLFPALSEAKAVQSDLSFDWVVDTHFQEISLWHPSVKNIFITNHRTWRKHLFKKTTWSECSNILKQIQSTSYDLIIDGQGNFKSAIIGKYAKGPLGGFDGPSIKEWGAHFLYDLKCAASKELHAIERLRLLFSHLLGYKVSGPPLYNINEARLTKPAGISLPEKFLLFVPIASHPSKLWDERYWKKLAQLCQTLNIPILIPSGTDEEALRARRIAEVDGVLSLPRLSLCEIGHIVRFASGVVSVDTGISHIAAALSTPTITVYGPTKPEVTGTIGANQLWIKGLSTPPEEVFAKLKTLLN